MKQRDLLFVAAGVGVLYFLTRPTSTYGQPVGTPTPSGGTAFPVPGVGSLIGSLSNFVSGIFRGGGGSPVLYSNPGINAVTNPTSYPSYPTTPPPAADTYNVCDPASVDYNPDVCYEMYPNG